jgi:hypothetical protein
MFRARGNPSLRSGQVGWNRVNQILAPCSGEFCFLNTKDTKSTKENLCVLRALSGENKEVAMTTDGTTVTQKRLGGV